MRRYTPKVGTGLAASQQHVANAAERLRLQEAERRLAALRKQQAERVEAARARLADEGITPLPPEAVTSRSRDFKPQPTLIVMPPRPKAPAAPKRVTAKAGIAAIAAATMKSKASA